MPERGEGIRAPDFLTFETSRVELRLLKAMGKETANIRVGTEEAAGDPEGSARAKRELAGASGASDGERYGRRIGECGGSASRADSAGALLEGKSRARTLEGRRAEIPVRGVYFELRS